MVILRHWVLGQREGNWRRPYVDSSHSPYAAVAAVAAAAIAAATCLR